MEVKLQLQTTSSELEHFEGATTAPAACERLSPAQITQVLAAYVKKEQSSHAAWLSINLQRSDRLHALAQYPMSKIVTAEAAKRVQRVLRPPIAIPSFRMTKFGYFFEILPAHHSQS